MPLLTSRELADLRSDILDLLPDTCRIERMTFTNTTGNAEESWGTAVASMACRFDPDTSRKETETVAEQEAHLIRYIVTLPYNANVQDGDRLVFAGNTYEMLQIHDVHSSNATKRLKVSLIK